MLTLRKVRTKTEVRDRKLKYRLLAIFALFVFLGCWGNAESKNFNTVGYFKDSDKTRIFTVSYTADTLETEIKAYGANQMHSPGAMTTTYFYPANTTDIPDVTLAGHAGLALLMGATPELAYQGTINARGEYVFIKLPANKRNH